jgi:hypothetical protein
MVVMEQYCGFFCGLKFDTMGWNLFCASHDVMTCISKHFFVLSSVSKADESCSISNCGLNPNDFLCFISVGFL